MTRSSRNALRGGLCLAASLLIAAPGLAYAAQTKKEKAVSVKSGTDASGIKGIWVTVTEDVYEWVADARPAIASAYRTTFGTVPSGEELSRMAALIESGKLTHAALLAGLRSMKDSLSYNGMPLSFQDGQIVISDHRPRIDSSRPSWQWDPDGRCSFEPNQIVDLFAIARARGEDPTSPKLTHRNFYDVNSVQGDYLGSFVFKPPPGNKQLCYVGSPLAEASRLARLKNLLDLGIAPPTTTLKVGFLPPGPWVESVTTFDRTHLSQLIDLTLRNAQGQNASIDTIGLKYLY